MNVTKSMFWNCTFLFIDIQELDLSGNLLSEWKVCSATRFCALFSPGYCCSFESAYFLHTIGKKNTRITYFGGYLLSAYLSLSFLFVKTFFYSKNSTRITCKTPFYLLCMAHYLVSDWSTQQLLFNPFSLIFLQDVGIICEQLPALKALNLSYNLMSPYKSELPLLKSIRVLVLNNTGVDWEQVSFFLFSQLMSLA